MRGFDLTGELRTSPGVLGPRVSLAADVAGGQSRLRAIEAGHLWCPGCGALVGRRASGRDGGPDGSPCWDCSDEVEGDGV